MKYKEQIQKAVYTTEKFGSGPVKKAVRTHNVCKEMLEFRQGHRRLWSCRNSSVSLQKLWVRTAFSMGPDPNFSVVQTAPQATTTLNEFFKIPVKPF